MTISFIVLGTILFSLGFVIYKKIAEPISLYVVNQSIRISKDEFNDIEKENKELTLDVEKLQLFVKRSEK